jgi:hypothetical protein
LTSLLLGIVYHFLLSLVPLLLIWGGGLGWWSLLRRQRRGEPTAFSVLYGYPCGVVGATLSALLLSSSVHWLRFTGAGLLLAVGLCLFLNRAEAKSALRAVWAPVLVALPFTFGFVVLQGILQHGPTRELAASPRGDLIFYVAQLYAYHASPFPAPHVDLMSEGFSYNPLISSSASLIGATLSCLPGFDPFLFYAVSGPAFYLLSLCIACGLLRKTAIATGPEDGTSRWERALLVPLLLLGVIVCPSWTIESPPVCYAVPLGFVAFALSVDERKSMVEIMTLMILIFAATIFTKVFAVIPCAVIGFVLIVLRLGRRFQRSLWVMVTASALLGGTFVVYMLHEYSYIFSMFQPEFLPLDALLRVLGFAKGAGTQDVISLVEVIGQGLLILAAWRGSHRGVMLALTVGTLAYWLWHSFAYIAFGVGLAIMAGAMCSDPVYLWRQRHLVVVGAVLLLVRVWWMEVHMIGLRDGRLSLLLMAFSFLPMATRLLRQGTKAAEILAHATRVLSAGAFVGVVLVMVALASGVVGRRTYQVVALTPSDYDIWNEVRRRTPKDALLFTDWTGESIDIKHGWNYYAAVSERQLYLGGWYDGRLRTDPGELKRRLQWNEDVLQGVTAPQAIPVSGRYSSYFAVVDRSRRMPATFAPVYSNAKYTLYKVER